MKNLLVFATLATLFAACNTNNAEKVETTEELLKKIKDAKKK